MLSRKVLQQFQNNRMLLRTAQATHKILAVVEVQKKALCFFAFAILRCCKSKKVFAQADRAYGIKHQTALKT